MFFFDFIQNVLFGLIDIGFVLNQMDEYINLMLSGVKFYLVLSMSS